MNAENTITENANINKEIQKYLLYLRDVGMDNIYFEHDSEIRKLLTRANPNRYNVSAPTPPRTATQFPSAKFAPKTQTPKDTNPFAKLSKLRSGDALGLSKFDRPTSSAHSAPRSEKREKLAALYHDVQSCEKCSALSVAVFGAGSAEGRIFVVGDAPTADDTAAANAVARPFTGETGELISKLFDRLGVDKSRDIFLTYLQKCGAAFDPELATRCMSIFDKQISIIEPKVILVFGEVAAKFLLKSESDIEQLRGGSHTYNNVPVIVTYDVPKLIDEPEYRKETWKDVQKLLAIVGGA